MTIRVGWGAACVIALCASLIVSGSTADQESLPGHTSWTLAAAGDAITTRRLPFFDNKADPRFGQLVKLIRAADVAVVNLEVSLFRLEEFQGWPEVENGGNWELGPPEAATDLKAMGFRLFNHANNHTTDWGVAGMRATDQLLDSLELVHAGSGRNLGQASRPGYLDSAKGRIALIGMATTFQPMERAGDPRGPVMGRPGINAVRIARKYQLEAQAFDALRASAQKLGVNVADNPDAPLRIFGVTIERDKETRVIETINPVDADRVLREVRNAADQADYVIVYSHSHEPGNASLVPPPWMVEFAKKCIDAGATTFLISGPHQIRGIEIYKGRPIFYSLGNFIFQEETIDPMPQDFYEELNLPATALSADLYDKRFNKGTTGFPSSSVWYESVVPIATFKEGQLIGLVLHPIDLGHKEPRSQRGNPRIATEAVGRKIIGRLSEQSSALGTTIKYENGVGVWVPSAVGTGDKPPRTDGRK